MEKDTATFEKRTGIDGPMLMVITLKSGVQIKVGVSEYTTRRYRTGDLAGLRWTATEDTEMIPEYVDMDEVAAVHTEYPDDRNVPLRLTATGPGSRPEIIDYVRTVIEERTTPNDDTTAERLAKGITTSVLSRLGAGYTASAGGWPPPNPERVEVTEDTP